MSVPHTEDSLGPQDVEDMLRALGVVEGPELVSQAAAICSSPRVIGFSPT